MKRMARADKRKHLNNLTTQTEEASSRGQQGRVYKITKLVCCIYRRNNDGPIKNKQGKLPTTEAEQDARWSEHFKEVLNTPPPPIKPDIQEAETVLDVDTYPPRKEEIISAIKSLKNGKSPGRDNLNAILFKADPQLAADILQPLLTSIWEEKKLPDDWTEGVIIKIPKSGALNNCNNWRGITLLSVPSKILASSKE